MAKSQPRPPLAIELATPYDPPYDLVNTPDPFAFIAVWGIPPTSREGFDLLVGRQLLWQPRAAPAVRRMFLTEDGQPICPVCGEVVTPGAPAVVCAAVLADRALQEHLRRDPTIIATRSPDAREAWWLLHGACHESLDRTRIQQLNVRIELALRAAARTN